LESNLYRQAINLVTEKSDKARLSEAIDIHSENNELSLIAASNKLFSSDELEQIARSIPKSEWTFNFTIMGIATNENISSKLLDEIIESKNPIAYLVWAYKLPKRKFNKLELHPDPAVRSLLNQSEKYFELLTEARDIKTSSKRLNEIYKLELRDFVPKSYKTSFDYDFYEFNSTNIFVTSDTLSEVWQNNIDFEQITSDFKSFMAHIESNRNLKILSLYFELKFVDQFEFNFLRGATLANLNMQLENDYEFTKADAHYPADLILEADMPGLHFLLDDLIDEEGVEFSAHFCIDWVRSLYQLQEENWSELAQNLNISEFTFYEDPDSAIDDYVRAAGIYLASKDVDFLVESFASSMDDYLKMAILYNPNSTETMREQAPRSFSPPIPLALAKAAVYTRQFHLLPNWIESESEFNDLLKICSFQYHAEIQKVLQF
jgi:hypothetical protein